MIKYRSDIDGLRAFAVISVLIFHFNNKWLQSGFLGVDVFFVISGYLITSIIYKESIEGHFSISNFYIKRFRRILPAMWFITLVTLLIGIILLLPSDLKFLVKSIKSILTFSSNYFFATETDYFNPIAEQYPLLHTWSLAVEEQFYLIWPLILNFLVNKEFSNIKIRFILIVSALSSFLIWKFGMGSEVFSKYLYYSLPTRMGGLLIGSLVAILNNSDCQIKRYHWQNIKSCIGIGLLVFLLVHSKDQLSNQALVSLLASLGTALLLDSGADSIINRLLSQKWMVYVGTISYSLYLWHWPILAYLRYFGDMTPFKILLGVFLTLIGSIWSKNRIEDRYRKLNIDFKSAFLRFWIYPGLAFLIVSVLIYDFGGLPQRYFLSTGDIVGDTQPFYKRFCHEQLIGDCQLGIKSKKPKLLLIGDSHASHFMPFLDKIAKNKKFSIYARSSGFCSPTFQDSSDESENCQNQKKWFREHYKEFETVIFGGRWESYLSQDPLNKKRKQKFLFEFERTLQFLRDVKINTIVIAQIPKFEDQTYEFLLRKKYFLMGLYPLAPMNLDQLQYDSNVDLSNEFLKNFGIKSGYFTFWDPIRENQLFMKNLPMRTNGMAYKDGSHLNESGAIEMADLFLFSNLKLPFMY